MESTKPQSEYFFKLTGSSFIEKELDTSKTYSLTFKSVDIYNTSKKEGEGEADKITYSGRSTGPVLMTDGEKMIEGSKKNPKKLSKSQHLRFAIEKLRHEEFSGVVEDEERFYGIVMGLLGYKLNRGDFNDDLLNLINQTIK